MGGLQELMWQRRYHYGNVEVVEVAGEHVTSETHDGVRVVLVGVDQVVVLLGVQHALPIGQSVTILQRCNISI